MEIIDFDFGTFYRKKTIKPCIQYAALNLQIQCRNTVYKKYK